MKRFFGHLCGFVLLAAVAQSYAASGDEGVGAAPAAPAAPAVPGAALPPALPTDPGLATPPPMAPAPPALPALPGADLTGGFGTAAPGAIAVPTPPPLTGLSIATDATTTETTSAVAAQSGPIDTYDFLFREDTDLGVVREKYTFEESQRVRDAEINRYVTKYQVPGQQQQQQPGQDPRAGAEWDFYFQQFELYNRYVRERLLPDVADMPAPTYDAANYLQERNDMKNAYDKAAISTVNAQSEENIDFYDRLQAREDRRRAYYEWLADQQRDLDEWAMIWARRVNGLQWRAEDQPVRRDDWYYGVNFASAEPKIVKIEGREYLVSQEPQKNVPPQQLNVLSSNLTPYDIIDMHGDLKTPDMERVRGTAVIPPEDVIEVAPGTLEMVPE